MPRRRAGDEIWVVSGASAAWVVTKGPVEAKLARTMTTQEDQNQRGCEDPKKRSPPLGLTALNKSWRAFWETQQDAPQR